MQRRITILAAALCLLFTGRGVWAQSAADSTSGSNAGVKADSTTHVDSTRSAGSSLPDAFSIQNSRSIPAEIALRPNSWQIGLGYSLLNDLSLRAAYQTGDLFGLQASISGYSSTSATSTEYRYRASLCGQLCLIRNTNGVAYLGFGAEWFRRPNYWYEYGYWSTWGSQYRTNIEPFLCIGGYVHVYSRLSLSLIVTVDSYTFAQPQDLYFLYYFPPYYPGFEMGLSVTLL